MNEYTETGRLIKKFDFKLQKPPMPKHVAEKLATYLPPTIAAIFLVMEGHADLVKTETRE
jgi:hypothetical protein